MIEEIIELNEIEEKARKYLSLSSEPVFFIHGNVGAGKTTLIQAFCKALGVTQVVQSPSFGLLHQYSSTNGPIFHADLYRLHNPEELYDIGIFDALDSGHYCFIEWPAILLTHFSVSGTEIHLTYHTEQTRKIVIQALQ